MELLAINGKPCPATVAETLALVQNIEGNLSIEAHHPSIDDIYIPEPTKTVTAQQKIDDSTRDKAPVSIDAEQKTQEEEKKETSKEEEDTSFVVVQLDEVQKSIADEMEDEEDENEAEEENVEESAAENEEDDKESSTYESLPPPKDEP
jgi:predicted transcriptional regulator